MLKRAVIGLMVAATSFSASEADGIQAAAKTEQGDLVLSWQQSDRTLALAKQGQVVWRFSVETEKGSAAAYFHPLRPVGGPELTLYRPADHPWHTGLWFSWKYINHVNYWDWQKAGVLEGITDVTELRITPRADFSATVNASLEYHPAGQPSVMSERRLIEVAPPDRNGSYRIDWTDNFTAGSEDLVLDRTPIPGEPDGKPFGGYAGFGVRMPENLKALQFLDSGGGTKWGALRDSGQRAKWLDYSCEGDGGVGGLAIFDHPDNLRHPSPWWGGAYTGPMLLHFAPYTLAARKSLTLKYRVLVHAGRLNVEALESEWKAFAGRK